MLWIMKVNRHKEKLNEQLCDTGQYWCKTHNRDATHRKDDGSYVCDPKLGGIAMPCKDVVPIKVPIDA